MCLIIANTLYMAYHFVVCMLCPICSDHTEGLPKLFDGSNHIPLFGAQCRPKPVDNVSASSAASHTAGDSRWLPPRWVHNQGAHWWKIGYWMTTPNFVVEARNAVKGNTNTEANSHPKINYLKLGKAVRKGYQILWYSYTQVNIFQLYMLHSTNTEWQSKRYHTVVFLLKMCSFRSKL